MSDEKAYVHCSTTNGDFTIALYRAWSPNGYDRAVELFKRGYYDGSHFFRVVPGFLVQFGISYSTDMELKKFANTRILDDAKHDPPIHFHEGIVSYAGSGPDSRTSQLFISYGSAPSLGRELWETPIGEIIEGIKTLRGLYSDYGDMPPWGKGPVQQHIHQGPKYIEENYPKLDSFKICTVSHSKAIEEANRLGSPLKVQRQTMSSSLSNDDKPVTEIGGLTILGGIGVFFIIACVVFSILQRRHRKDTKTT